MKRSSSRIGGILVGHIVAWSSITTNSETIHGESSDITGGDGSIAWSEMMGTWVLVKTSGDRLRPLLRAVTEACIPLFVSVFHLAPSFCGIQMADGVFLQILLQQKN